MTPEKVLLVAVVVVAICRTYCMVVVMEMAVMIIYTQMILDPR